MGTLASLIAHLSLTQGWFLFPSLPEETPFAYGYLVRASAKARVSRSPSGWVVARRAHRRRHTRARRGSSCRGRRAQHSRAATRARGPSPRRRPVRGREREGPAARSRTPRSAPSSRGRGVGRASAAAFAADVRRGGDGRSLGPRDGARVPVRRARDGRPRRRGDGAFAVARWTPRPSRAFAREGRDDSISKTRLVVGVASLEASDPAPRPRAATPTPLRANHPSRIPPPLHPLRAADPPRPVPRLRRRRPFRSSRRLATLAARGSPRKPPRRSASPSAPSPSPGPSPRAHTPRATRSPSSPPSARRLERSTPPRTPTSPGAWTISAPPPRASADRSSASAAAAAATALLTTTTTTRRA